LKQLESYQAARVHDVDEKAWLSKRMSTFEAALKRIAAFSPGLTPIQGDPIEIARAALSEAGESK